MTLLLKREELEGILDLEQALEVSRLAVLEEVAGTAVHMPGFGGSGGKRFIMRVTGGGLFGLGRMGIRAGSLTLLFDAETSEPLAIMDLPQGNLRLAASAGLAARHLARPDARRVGLLGSGMISLPILQGLCAVRSIEAIDVYSPTPEHRLAFAERATRLLEVPVAARDAPEPVIEGADILVTATNSRTPVVTYDQLRPGAHVSSGGLAMELDASIYLQVDQLVAFSRSQEVANAAPTNVPGRVTGGIIHDLLTSGALKPESIVELGHLASGEVPAKNGPEHINLYRDTRGGTADAALAIWAYDRAKERGLGVEFAFREEPLTARGQRGASAG